MIANADEERISATQNDLNNPVCLGSNLCNHPNALPESLTPMRLLLFKESP